MSEIPTRVKQYSERLDSTKIVANHFHDGREKYEIEVPTLKQPIGHYPKAYMIYELSGGRIELVEEK
jgi:hypothetical protein